MEKNAKEVLSDAAEQVLEGFPHDHATNVKRIGLRLLTLMMTDDRLTVVVANSCMDELGEEGQREVLETQDQQRVATMADKMMLEALDWARGQLAERIGNLEGQ